MRQWAVPRFTFFVGKGGVGKTTVSSSYALYRAAKTPKRNILLLSSDPAHSLSDVMQVRLGNAQNRLRTAGRLWARQIDAETQIDNFLRIERSEILALLSKGSLFSSDELEPLLDASLPGMAEVAALLAIYDLLRSEFDEVVVDTAPMGHAIRLFQMPQHFARFLDVLQIAASRDAVLARHFGGHAPREPALERWSLMVERVTSALSAGDSKLVLVTTAEPFALNESARSASAFPTAAPSNQITEIVLNRVVRRKTSCPHCEHRRWQYQSARSFLRTRFAKGSVLTGEDPGCPILGMAALRDFGEHVFERKKLAASICQLPAQSPKPKLENAQWPRLNSPLTLTVGKGGVGKTTVSAALAYSHRQAVKGAGVNICSIDPAPSLDDVFGAEVTDSLRPVLGDRKLRAAEFDAMVEFRQWSEELRQTIAQALRSEEAGPHVDLSLDRRFLLSLLEIVPPGVDEIFAILRILDLLQSKERVVIDMAPTGHALEVLRTPARLLAWCRLLLKTLAAHRKLPLARDAAVELAKASQRLRELTEILRDPKRCQVVTVALAEPLPDYETGRLLRALRELEAPIQCVFVNRVLAQGSERCARCKLSAQWQAASLAGMRRRLRPIEIYVVRERDAPIAGAKALYRFTQELWRLV